MASFNVENLFPIGKMNDERVITQEEYDERVDALVLAIRDRLREPDVIAVQEVAVIVDGANALTGLAQALGNYTGYIAPNNDGRGIAPASWSRTARRPPTAALLDERDRSTATVGERGGVRPARAGSCSTARRTRWTSRRAT